MNAPLFRPTQHSHSSTQSAFQELNVFFLREQNLSDKEYNVHYFGRQVQLSTSYLSPIGLPSLAKFREYAQTAVMEAHVVLYIRKIATEYFELLGKLKPFSLNSLNF